MEPDRRVLSVQSHVVHGYVGNRCAALSLQLLGLEVDVLNTVQFSNHTGYPVVKGSKLSARDLLDLFEALSGNGLADAYTHLLTGYIGSVEFLNSITSVLGEIKKKSPTAQYICDPVMGDNGKLYVSEDMVPAFRELIKHADVVTPNQFEAELLTDIKITTIADAVATCKHFHALGITRVVLTSLEFPDIEGKLVILGSDSREGVFSVTIPKLDCYFTGTGDMMAAVLLGWGSLEESFSAGLEKAVASVQAAVEVTIQYYCERLEGEKGKKGIQSKGEADLEKSTCLDARELRLVAARREVMSPVVHNKAVKL